MSLVNAIPLVPFLWAEPHSEKPEPRQPKRTPSLVEPSCRRG